MKMIKIYLLFFSIFLSVALLLYGQKKNDDLISINIGFSSNLFPESDFRDVKASIELWSKELIKDGYLNYYLVASVFQSNNEIVNAFKKNKISIAAMHALDYLYIKNESSIVPLLIPSIKDDVTENYIILTNKKSNIKNIFQLKNKKIAISKVDSSMISYLWFENLVMINQSKLVDNFCFISEVKKDNKAIFSVFFHQNDACVVSTKVYNEMCKLNKQLIDDLVIIQKSPNYIRDIFCISKNLEKKYIGKLFDATVSITNYESGKKMMNFFQFERFTIFEEKYIKSLEKLLSDNRKYHKKFKNKIKRK